MENSQNLSLKPSIFLTSQSLRFLSPTYVSIIRIVGENQNQGKMTSFNDLRESFQETEKIKITTLKWRLSQMSDVGLLQRSHRFYNKAKISLMPKGIVLCDALEQVGLREVTTRWTSFEIYVLSFIVSHEDASPHDFVRKTSACEYSKARSTFEKLARNQLLSLERKILNENIYKITSLGLKTFELIEKIKSGFENHGLVPKEYYILINQSALWPFTKKTLKSLQILNFIETSMSGRVAISAVGSNLLMSKKTIRRAIYDLDALKLIQRRYLDSKIESVLITDRGRLFLQGLEALSKTLVDKRDING